MSLTPGPPSLPGTASHWSAPRPPLSEALAHRPFSGFVTATFDHLADSTLGAHADIAALARHDAPNSQPNSSFSHNQTQGICSTSPR